MFRFFENLVNPFGPYDQATPPKNIWAYFKTQFGPFRKWMWWLGLSALVVAVIETSIVFYTGHVIDLMEGTQPRQFWSEHGLELGLASIVILLIRPLAIMLNHLFLEQMLAGNMQDQVRWRAHKHLLRQPISFFQNDFAGRLSNRVMQVGAAVEDSTYMAFEGILFATSYVISAMFIMGQIDLRLAAPLALWLVFYIFYVRYMAVRVGVASEKWSDARSRVTGRIVDAYTNIESVKLFSQGESEERYVLSSMRRLRLRFMRFLRLMTELSFGLSLLNAFLTMGVLGTAVFLWSKGQISIGEAAAASALTVRLNGMSGWIMWITIRLFEHFGVIREALRSIAVEPSLKDCENAPALQYKKGEIRFANISHHYGKDKGGLDQVSLVIKPGEKIGLVGRSGAGKSSLVNLLLRYHDPEQGQVLFDGQDVSQLRQDSLRAQIGMVSQDSSLLHRSLRANLLYGRPSASEAQMISAAKQAQAHEFIQTLADPQGRTGYNAYVGERGVKLSGGQRQRVAIARVILKDAPVLVLDEATSALDSEVEAEIQKTLYGMMKGKTVIAIAHRLSTIAQMDRVIVLDEGKVIEEGPHDALLAENGVYAGLWARQSGGFLGKE